MWGVWLLLAVVLGVRLAIERDRFGSEARSPAGFTSVAGTAVLGTRRPRRPGSPLSSAPPKTSTRTLGLAAIVAGLFTVTGQVPAAAEGATVVRTD